MGVKYFGETQSRNGVKAHGVSGKIFKNSIYNVIQSLGTILFPVLTFSYISRIFLADGIGRINFAGSMISIFTMLSMLGIRLYGIRECSKRRDDKKALSKLFSELLTINIISVFLAYILLFCFAGISPKVGEYRIEVYLYSIGMLFGFMGVEWLFTSVEDYRYLAIRSLIVQLISLLAVVTFVHKKDDVSIYILISVMASGGNNVIALFYARKYVTFMKIHIRDLLSHARPIINLFLVTIFIRVFTDMDTVMVGYLSTESEVGLYSASYKISSIISTIISTATTVVVPRIAYEFEKKSSKANEILKMSIQYIWLIGLPLAVGACIYSQNFIVILSGQGFIDATASSRILSIRTILSPINCMLLLHYLVPRGNEKESIIITAAAALGNVVLNACLIPTYGAIGASIATVAAELIEFIVMRKYILRYVKLTYVFEGIHHYVFASVPVAIIAILTLSIKQELLSIVLGVAIAVPIYAGMLKLFRNQYFESGLSTIKTMLKHD